MKLGIVLSLIFSAFSLSSAQNQTRTAVPAEIAATQRKLDHIESNGRSSRPDQSPTLFTEDEINKYLASDDIDWPAGVEAVKLQFQPGIISGNARVNFDKALAGARSSNPLLSMFSGVHEVAATTHAHGAGGQGYVHIDSVSLDGIEVPNFVLQLFIEKYLQPKYPQIGIDSRFELPDRIDAANVGQRQLTLIQK